MEQALLQHFRQLITAHTGLQIREQDREAFERTLAGRVKSLQLSQPAQYYQLLENGGAQSEAEWKQLIVLLTNQESYFFRDKGQFALLQERILPELIRNNQTHRSLRIWSAGCSTGEEPFSLAMLVDQLLPKRDGWNIFILGTDLKEDALEKARRGIYSSWSFRLVDPALQQRYFRKQQADYKLDDRIRDMVTLRPGNLFKDEFPDSVAGLYNMDLILCRNVFIYFKWDAVSVVLDKLTGTLRDDGYLMTGHNELSAQNLNVRDEGRLQPRVLPGSVIYQRLRVPSATTKPVVTQNQGEQPSREKSADSSSITSASLETTIARLPQSPLPASRSTQGAIQQDAVSTASLNDASSGLLEEAEILFRNRAHGAAAEKLELLLRSDPQNYAANCLAARAYANLGWYDEAIHRCRQAIAIDSFSPIPYSLLAHIAEEQGNSEEAKNLLKKVIYLVPSFTSAYLDLGAIYEEEGDVARAKRMRVVALELLQAQPPEAIIEPYGLAAHQLIEQLK